MNLATLIAHARENIRLRLKDADAEDRETLKKQMVELEEMRNQGVRIETSQPVLFNDSTVVIRNTLEAVTTTNVSLKGL